MDNIVLRDKIIDISKSFEFDSVEKQLRFLFEYRKRIADNLLYNLKDGNTSLEASVRLINYVNNIIKELLGLNYGE